MVDQDTQEDVYHKLTPVNDVEMGEYENALLYALSDIDVKNIAITGVYGSGKSSLIKTFEAKYENDKRFNFLNVSLASFVLEPNPTFNNEDTSQQNIKNSGTQDIEKSLLQQIIFKVKSDSLEDSQFSRIKIKRYWLNFLTSNVGLAIFVVSLMLSLKFIFKPDYFLFNESWLFNKNYMSYFLLIGFVGVLGLIQLLFNLVPKLGLSKLSAGGAEISFNDRGDSILNKHLDELIYFFATTRFNIVVFEDLDRLPSREILIKLREINQLLNNSEEINNYGKKKVIKFIFALGDDLFTNAIDRTKFFDFIIPVIPLVNYSNSRQKLEAAIKKAFPQVKFKSNFLDEVTQFLDDMRLLFNVANEFIVYKKRLDAEFDRSTNKDKLKLDNTKLLALIIYKNKDPDDFAKLNRRQGKIWGILTKKDNLIQAAKLDISNKIDEIKQEILNLESGNLADVNELKRSYLGYYFLNYPDLQYFHINGSNYPPNQLYQDDSIFELLQSQSNIRYIKSNGSGSALQPFSQIEKEVHAQLTYQQRKERLNKHFEGAISTLNSQLLKYEKVLDGFQRLSLAQLVKSQSDLAFRELGTEDDLIKYLIIEDLIGEDFLTYTTYFYPGELTSNDQQYLISQLSNTPLDIAYSLDDPEKVFNKVKEERFKSLAILNLDILTFASLYKQNTKKANILIETIIDSKEKGYALLQNWFKLASLEDVSKRYVFNKITKKNVYFWAKYFESLELTNNEKGNLVISLLEHLDEDALKLINNTGLIQFELNDNAELLNLIHVLGYEKLEKLFKQFNLVFSNIVECDDIRLLNVIEKTNAYEITIGNLIKLLSCNSQTPIEVVPTYSYILQYGSEAIKKYIQRELRWFVVGVLENLESPEEEESSAITLLQNDELENELKISLIQKLRFKIKDIEAVADQTLWPELLKSKRIIATWGNVLKYFTLIEQEFDKVLELYLSDGENVASLIRGYLRHDVPDELKLAKAIIKSAAIDDKAYEQLTKVISIIFSDLSDIKVNVYKLEALLNTGRFNLSVKNHEFLKANLPTKSYLLLEQHFDDFMERISEIKVNSSELISLVSISKLNESQKISLIKVTPDNLYANNLAKAYCEFILNLKKGKFSDINPIKKILLLDIDQDLKVQLFNQYSDKFDHLTVIELISNMPNALSRLVENKHAILLKNIENLKLVNFLSSLEYISYKDYKKDNDKIELTPKRKMVK